MRFSITLLFLFQIYVLFAQIGPNKVVVAGVVTDENGSNLRDVHVVSKKQGFGTITNENGYFKINVDPNDTLVFMYVGMSEKYYPVGKSGENVQLVNVLLESSSFLLKEAKVSPYLSKKDLSYHKLPMDATEAARYDLRQKALRADKTYFETFGVNFVTLIPILIKALAPKNPKPKITDKMRRQQQMLNNLYASPDFHFSDTIPIDSMKHPSRKVFIK